MDNDSVRVPARGRPVRWLGAEMVKSQAMNVDEVLARAESVGIDLSLLREALRLTPTERLRRHEQALALAEAFRRAGEKKNGPFPPLAQLPLSRRG